MDSTTVGRCRRWVLFWSACALFALAPVPAFAMHIAEGIITGWPVLAYTFCGIVLMAIGTQGIKTFQRKFPDRKPLIGMGAALVFFISLIPVPAFTGTTSHPCGTPLVAILLGPRVTFALTGISLILQAAFFAHGGFGTWGANLMALGFVGGTVGWARIPARKANGPADLVRGLRGRTPRRYRDLRGFRHRACDGARDRATPAV